ncbi:MAG: hypothetical protein C0483_00660 [Pirellula sp.]|nr:hypothetical protein [Pirellula sp.]
MLRIGCALRPVRISRNTQPCASLRTSQGSVIAELRRTRQFASDAAPQIDVSPRTVIRPLRTVPDP